MQRLLSADNHGRGLTSCREVSGADRKVVVINRRRGSCSRRVHQDRQGGGPVCPAGLTWDAVLVSHPIARVIQF